jgi:hypothetical protein
MSNENSKTALEEIIRQRGSYLAFLPFLHVAKDRAKLLNEIRNLTNQITQKTNEKLGNRPTVRTE